MKFSDCSKRKQNLLGKSLPATEYVLRSHMRPVFTSETVAAATEADCIGQGLGNYCPLLVWPAHERGGVDAGLSRRRRREDLLRVDKPETG